MKISAGIPSEPGALLIFKLFAAADISSGAERTSSSFMVRWELLAADQLWMGPQGWSGLASPRDAPPREKECLSCLCSVGPIIVRTGCVEWDFGP